MVFPSAFLKLNYTQEFYLSQISQFWGQFLSIALSSLPGSDQSKRHYLFLVTRDCLEFNKNLICEISGKNEILFCNRFIITDSIPYVWEQRDTGSWTYLCLVLCLKLGTTSNLDVRKAEAKKWQMWQGLGRERLQSSCTLWGLRGQWHRIRELRRA